MWDGNAHKLDVDQQNIIINFQNNYVTDGENLFCGTLTLWKTVTIKNNLFLNGKPGLSALGSAIQLNDAQDLINHQSPSVTATITNNVINNMFFAGILLDNLASATVTGNRISNVKDAAIQVASYKPKYKH